MSKSGAFDPSGLSALVVDRTHGRLLTLEQLRLMGFINVAGASNTAAAWEAFAKDKPDILLVEWLDPANETLDFIRRVRSEGSPNRAVSMFMLTSRGSLGDVEAARHAGVDAYLRKPISAAAMQERVKTVVMNPQPFIVTATYVGPCRRRRQEPDFAGPYRRSTDGAEETSVDRARACVAALDARAKTFNGADPEVCAALAQAAAALCDVAESDGDASLMLASKELIRYLGAQSDAFALDAEAVRTHIAALHQFVHLPRTMNAERDHVAQSLKRMVDKKLKLAS